LKGGKSGNYFDYRFHDNPYFKNNSSVNPRNSVFIGDALNPSYKYTITYTTKSHIILAQNNPDVK